MELEINQNFKRATEITLKYNPLFQGYHILIENKNCGMIGSNTPEIFTNFKHLIDPYIAKDKFELNIIPNKKLKLLDNITFKYFTCNNGFSITTYNGSEYYGSIESIRDINEFTLFRIILNTFITIHGYEIKPIGYSPIKHIKIVQLSTESILTLVGDLINLQWEFKLPLTYLECLKKIILLEGNITNQKKLSELVSHIIQLIDNLINWYDVNYKNSYNFMRIIHPDIKPIINDLIIVRKIGELNYIKETLSRLLIGEIYEI